MKLQFILISFVYVVCPNLTDGCPNLTGKNVGLLKRMQDKVTEINPEHKLVFLHCIIHQEVLCKSVLKINHVVDVVTKIVNLIRARALNHRHRDIPCSCQVAQPGQSAEKSMGPERRDSRLLCEERKIHPTAFRCRLDGRPWFCCRCDCTNE